MIESLSYIGFTSPNAAEWTSFGPEVLGLEVVPPGPDGAVRLRLDRARLRRCKKTPPALVQAIPNRRKPLTYR